MQAVLFSPSENRGLHEFSPHCRVVGDFNSWDVCSSPKLEWSEGHVWKGRLDLTSPEIEFKLVIASKDNSFIQWEVCHVKRNDEL